MEKYNFSFEYYDDGVYNIEDVLGEFENFFGMDFLGCVEHFQNVDIMEKKDIIKKKSGEFYFDKKLQDIVNINHNYLKEYIFILRTKGLDYLFLFKYLNNLLDSVNRDIRYEDMLEESNIFHFRGVLTGEGIKRLLVGFGNTLKNFDEKVDMINNTNTYDIYLVDSFSKLFPEKIYPSKSIVLENEDIIDKTSVCRRKVRRIS